MMNTKRSTALWAAALVMGLGTATAQQSMTIGVWDDQGNPLTSGSVSATSIDGGSKGQVQPDGTFLLPSVGSPAPYGFKTSITVDDLAWGETQFDLMFNGNASARLDIVYTAFGVAEALSADVLPADPVSPGDGGAPSNDDCSNAIAVAVPSVTLGTTLGASGPDAPTCVTASTAPSVWYTVEGTGTTMSATLCSLDTDYDTKLSVYCGSCDDLTCITGNDDNFDCPISGLQSRVEWCSQAGATYYVMVHGFASNVGNFSLAISADAFPCTTPVECIPPDPIGACCFSDGTCNLLTEDACGGAGGDYQGDFSDCFGDGEETTYTSSPNAAIPDNNPVGITDTQNVGDDFLVADVNVELTITHTWQGDLIVSLEHGAESAELINRPGIPVIGAFGCSADNYNGVVIDDSGAGGSIQDQCAANLSSPPNYSGVDSLAAAFGGSLSGGDWTLAVSDNAGGDTGTLNSWSLILRAAGEGNCPGPECFLVVGPEAGTSTFVGAEHAFDVQISDVEDSYIVLMEDIPEFVLPHATAGRGGNNGGLNVGMQGGQPTLLHGPDSPEWMLDGQFNVQVLMWNPGVFPALPEQFSVGLEVEIRPNGRVITTQYGEGVGSVDIWAEISTNSDGQKVIRFPFLVELP